MVRKLIASLFISISMFAAGSILIPATAQAASRAQCEGNSAIPFVPKWYKYIPHRWDAETQSCIVNASFPGSIPAILLAVFEIILVVAGVLAVIFVVYGGFQYLITTGEPEKAKNARNTIINALVGLMITMFATVIVNLVGRNIG